FRDGKRSRLHRPDLRNRHFLFQLRQGQPHYSAQKQQFLGRPSIQLIDEGDVTFHGEEYHRMLFSDASGKKGPMHICVYCYRTGEWAITVQWIFPQPAKEKQVPDELSKFDQGVKINGK
ncbi:MAG: hypothetical protein JW959_05755, partial [Pirellulales bacterium]|nr:hypothetical protein [Pirellulales bacterium]